MYLIKFSTIKNVNNQNSKVVPKHTIIIHYYISRPCAQFIYYYYIIYIILGILVSSYFSNYSNQFLIRLSQTHFKLTFNIIINIKKEKLIILP